MSAAKTKGAAMPKPTRIIDGTRRRCLTCGHPKVEHRDHTPCTVPKCLCSGYRSPLPSELEAATGVG